MGAFDGRVALVTGGASGIGLATVRRLRAGGARVAVVDLAAPPDGAADLALAADVGDPAAWPALVERTVAELGGIDLAHLNAGAVHPGVELEDLDDRDYRRLMGVNVDGVVFAMREVIPAMSRRGGGRIVATASLAGLTPMPLDPLYTASKHAVVGLVRAEAVRLEPRGITVDAVCPGITETPLVAPLQLAALREAGFPLLTADDVALAVLGLLSTPGTGRCLACQPGRDPVVFRFGRVPGPRTPGREGMAPPL